MCFNEPVSGTSSSARFLPTGALLLLMSKKKNKDSGLDTKVFRE